MQKIFLYCFHLNLLKLNVIIITYRLGPLALPRSLPSPTSEHRSKRRRLSSEEDPLDVGGGRDKNNEVTYYGQSPASLSSQASWHSEVDHGKLIIFLDNFTILNVSEYTLDHNI